MDLIEGLMTTRAMRRYTDEPVTEEDVVTCLRAALQAPSGGNIQPWQFLVVTDPERRARLGEIYRRAYFRYEAAMLPKVPPFRDEASRASFDRTVAASRHLAEQIPGARHIEFPGRDHALFVGDPVRVAGVIEEFLTEAWEELPHRADQTTMLATVLFTDIVGSTEKMAELGDRVWRELLSEHHAAVRRQLGRYRGTEMDTTGDGFFARFDGPARAIRCAQAITEGVHNLGLEVRAGLHTGECEITNGKVAGIAVSTGARIAATAGPGEVLVSSTVKDLVAGSGLSFNDRGTHTLKGVPGEWRLYAVGASA